MQKIKATFDNDSFCCITWKQQNNGLYTVSSNFYGKDGYYLADLSNDRADIAYDVILNGIDSAKRLFKKVEIY